MNNKFLERGKSYVVHYVVSEIIQSAAAQEEKEDFLIYGGVVWFEDKSVLFRFQKVNGEELRISPADIIEVNNMGGTVNQPEQPLYMQGAYIVAQVGELRQAVVNEMKKLGAPDVFIERELTDEVLKTIVQYNLSPSAAAWALLQ